MKPDDNNEIVFCNARRGGILLKLYLVHDYIKISTDENKDR